MNRVCLIDGCYSAEESVGEWEPITLDGTVSFIEAVTSSVWWTDAFPRSVPVEVIEGGDEPSDARGLGFIRSFAYPVGGFTPERRVISMHPSMLDSRILIHELAHCASASTHGDFDRIHEGHMARGRYPLTPEIGHGIGDFRGLLSQNARTSLSANFTHVGTLRDAEQAITKSGQERVFACD